MNNRGVYAQIIPYTAQPSNTHNLEILSRYPWRHLLSPNRPYRKIQPCAGYAIDNGAWSAFKNKRAYNPNPFLDDVASYGENADFIVIPDVVEDAAATFKEAEKWIPMLTQYRCLIVAQDGMTIADFSDFVMDGIGVFIGGSTEYKLKNIKSIAALCDQYSVLCHVGRVNSIKRMHICINFGAHSFDGSGMARFARTARQVTGALLKLEHQLFKRDFNNIKRRYIDHEC